MTLQLNGIFPPIPTPFNTKGEIATQMLAKNLTHWNRFDLRGFVVLGSNGESVLLSEKEKLRVLEAARDAIPSDRLLVAGTGCQSTENTLVLTKAAAGIGANAALVLTPSYYKGQMTPAALVRHYHTVADDSPIPIIIYNMPACTGIDLTAEAVAAIAQHPNIIGIKDSGGNVVKMGDIRRLAGSRFQVLAGSANFLLPALSVGAVGGVLALANIAPSQCLAIRQYVLNGEWEQAREIQVRMIPVNTAVTRGWGVPALKAAMDMLGLFGGPVRPPLLPLSDALKAQLQNVLVEGGILQRTTSDKKGDLNDERP